MSTLTEAISRGESALATVDLLYLECPKEAIAEQHVIRQAFFDMGAALNALRRLQALKTPSEEARPL
jgi:hypothetical protein